MKLNNQEKLEVKNLLRTLNVEEIMKKYIGKRKFYTPNENIALYYIPDMSNIAIKQFIQMLKTIPIVLELETQVEACEITRGIVISRNIKNIYKEFEEKAKDTEYLYKVLQNYNQLKKEMEILLETGLDNDKIKELEDKLIQFRGLCLDNLLPVEYIKEKLQLSNEELQLLTTPQTGISHYMITYKGILKLLKNNNDKEIELFIENAGYTSGDDLFRSNMETKEGVKNLLEIYKTSFNNEYEIDKELELIENRLNNLLHKQKILIEKLNAKTKLHQLLLASAEYNELNRIYTKKYYKIIRKKAEENNLPLKYFTLEDLELYS